MSDLYRVIKFVTIAKVKDVPRERAIRFFRAAPGAWTLQVRAPLARSNRSDGADFIVASASLFVEDLVALRDKLNEQIARERRGAEDSP